MKLFMLVTNQVEKIHESRNHERRKIVLSVVMITNISTDGFIAALAVLFCFPYERETKIELNDLNISLEINDF